MGQVAARESARRLTRGSLRGPPLPDNAMAAPNPVVIVEVLSPGTTSVDTGAKLADYFRLASVQHYLLVRPSRRGITHHRRTAEGIVTRIVHEGAIEMDPPGIHLALDEIYAVWPVDFLMEYSSIARV